MADGAALWGAWALLALVVVGLLVALGALGVIVVRAWSLGRDRGERVARPGPEDGTEGVGDGGEGGTVGHPGD